MKAKISCTIMVVMLAASVAWGKDDVMSQAQSIFKPVPAKPPVLKGNRSSWPKLEPLSERQADPL